MKVKVNKEACIGCGACAAICDAVFEIDDEGLSIAKVEDVKEEDLDKWVAVIPHVLIEDKILILDESGYYRFNPESNAGMEGGKLTNQI